MKGVASALDNLARALGAESVAQKKLDEIRQVMSGMGQPSNLGESETENQFLQLVREGDYANTGEHFRIWELKVDVPTLPAFRDGGIRGKPYAQAGDQLWEETDSRKPFRLKRGQKEIGNPEWFQVRHLFEGLLKGAEESEVNASDSTITRLRELIPGGPRSWVRGNVFTGSALRYTAFLALKAINGTPIRRGDFVLRTSGRLDKKGRAAIKGRVIHVPRGSFADLEGQLEKLQFLEGGSDLDDLARYLSRARHPQCKGKDSTSPILIVRPLRSGVSEPIKASSDDAALFELVQSTGCQMPKKR
jgi:hypothetical protein